MTLTRWFRSVAAPPSHARTHCRVIPLRLKQPTRPRLNTLNAVADSGSTGLWRFFSREKPTETREFLYESQFGVPIVRQAVDYNDLLKDIRTGKVMSVYWFRKYEQGGYNVPGAVLVEYKDRSVKRSWVPAEDVRMRYAMEHHGVMMSAVVGSPPASQLKPYKPFLLQNVVETIISWIPLLGVFLLWLAVQLRDIAKGDYMDRMRMRQRQAQDAKESAKEAQEDDKILGIQKLVASGMPEARVRKEVRRMQLEISEEELEAMLMEARQLKARQESGSWNVPEQEEENLRKRQAALKQAEPGQDGDSKARMRGMQIRRARLRQANRTRMKGKLKHVESEVVFFEDVAGIDRAKQELAEVVDFFNFPGRYERSGARLPKGCLLYGPPGTGKTLLARAVANEANATFFGVNASEFVEMFIGVGAARVRDLFETARENAPAIIFVDELDAIGRTRGASQGNDERDQTLNQMLSEMDGFDARTGVVVIGATNRRDVLDPALIRPGRFDRQVYVGLPSRAGREAIFKVHLSRFNWKREEVDIEKLALATEGYSGAMIANLCNLAAIMANRGGRADIEERDFTAALLYEVQGDSTAPHPPQLTRQIAIIEGATALVGSLLPSLDLVEAVYVQPTEKRKIGQTVVRMREDRTMANLYTRRYLEEQLLMVLAGRVAERMVLGDSYVSTLTMLNIGRGRRIVHKLVLGAGMHEDPVIGPQRLTAPYAVADLDDRLDHYVGPHISYESMTAADDEMERRLHQAETDVQALLERNMKCLEIIIEKLTAPPYQLSGEEVRQVVNEHGHKDDLEQLKVPVF